MSGLSTVFICTNAIKEHACRPLPRQHMLVVPHPPATFAPQGWAVAWKHPCDCVFALSCSQELSFEKAIGRKVRVGQHTYEGSGRAGDLSAVFGAPKRPEDESTFFRVAKDSRTYSRFVSNLPAKPAISPHQRREEGSRRMQQAERERERQLVAALPVPE